jgi:pimeloyl-ACP methyl ester carboxylesterase
VTLTRGEPAAPKRPQTPARPFPYDEEEVTVRNEAAGVTLAGTFTRPRGGGRYPAVLLLTGSGQQDRDETLFEHKPFLVLSDYLTRRGIAVLRLDDRGVGGSGRGPLGITSKDLAGDALAGVALLRGRPDVDPARVGLVGHSEGAILAAMAAAETPDVAFIVMVAGTGVPGDRILLAQAAAAAKVSGASDAVIEWDRSVRERVYRVLAAESDGKPDAAARQRLLDEVATLASPGLPENAARDLASLLLKAGSQPWLRYFLVYDPRQALAKVKVPVLAVGGERDLQVPAGENLQEIERAVKSNGNADVTTVLLPGLNHLMQTSMTGSVAEYSTIEETFAPAALQLIGDWIVKRTSR